MSDIRPRKCIQCSSVLTEQDTSKLFCNECRKNSLQKSKHNFKYQCDCGGKYTHSNKARHFQTPKHIKYIQSLNQS